MPENSSSSTVSTRLVIGCGCGPAFILLGGTPLYAALNLFPNFLPREEFFSGSNIQMWMAALVGLMFISVGLYFLSYAFHPQPHPFPRFLALAVLLRFGVILHHWLFFGQQLAGGGIPFLPPRANLILGKLIVAALALMIDLG